jgi:signal transduction histidine kinase
MVQGGLPALQRREVVRRPDGTRVPILLNAVAIDAALLGEEQAEHATAASQRPTPGSIAPEWAALVLVQDISSVQAAEQLKDEFISVAAHELRTPLTAIQGFASMLEAHTALGRGAELVEWQSEAIAEIQVATARMNALVNDLLDVTRIQAGRLELHLAHVDLVAMLRRCLARLRLTAEFHTLALDVETPETEEPVMLEADGMRLEHQVQSRGWVDYGHGASGPSGSARGGAHPRSWDWHTGRATGEAVPAVRTGNERA